MAKRAVRVVVTGDVHGVGFRAAMCEVAREAGVAGWVRNAPGGKVEAFVEGEEAGVEAVVDWTRRGPARARVDSVEVVAARTIGLEEFSIAEWEGQEPF